VCNFSCLHHLMVNKLSRNTKFRNEIHRSEKRSAVSNGLTSCLAGGSAETVGHSLTGCGRVLAAGIMAAHD